MSSTQGKDDPIREVEGQIAVRLFDCSWRLSCCGAVLLAEPGSAGYRHPPCSNYLEYPRNSYWQTWFPVLRNKSDEVVKRFLKKHSQYQIQKRQSKGKHSVRVFSKENGFCSSHQELGVAVCLAVLQALVFEEKKSD